MIGQAVLLALLLSSEPRDLRAWTGVDTTLQVTFILVATADYLQTRATLQRPEGYERNPLLGRHPSEAKLALFAFGGIAAHTAIAYALPKPWRTLWQIAGISVEGAMLYGNYMAGARFSF